MKFNCAVNSFTFICCIVCIHYVDLKKKSQNVVFIHIKWPSLRSPNVGYDMGEMRT